MSGTGCATVDRSVSDPYVIAVRYDIEPMFTAMESDQAVAAVRRDFRDIARLGFNAVLLEHLSDDDAAGMVEIARESELTVLLPNRRLSRYISAGRLPRGVSQAERLPANQPRQVLSDAAHVKAAVMAPLGMESAGRCRQVISALNRSGFSCVTIGGQAGIASVDTGDEVSDPGYSPTESWLDRFHRGVRDGCTRGILLDRYRRLPGDPPGLADDNAPYAAARRAALSEIVDRAKRWGGFIKGLEVQDQSGRDAAASDVVLTVLSNQRCRLVMVHNSSPDAFVRHRILLSEQLAGAPLNRAVEVPPTASKPAGDVFTRSSTGITIPISLRPGDAALYEIF